MDPRKAVGLIDGIYEDDISKHLAFVNKMKGHQREQFNYTETLLLIHGDKAKETLTEYSMMAVPNKPKQVEEWLQILNINLDLACQLEPDSVVAKIKANKKLKLYPVDECLKICQKYNRTEACAILCKFADKFKDAVRYYVTLVNQTINTPSTISVFKKELYCLDKHIRVTLLKQKKKLSDM